MHEMSLCENIRDIIQAQAAESGFVRVNRVWLEVGPLSCVEPDALRFGFDVVMRGSVAEGAALEIATPAAKARCLACGQVAVVAHRYDPCPACGAVEMQVTQGDALKISKLEVV
ncbi:hydrogenase maturation nickel metallochaperone HypA [Yoonia sp. R2-816]|uniref:hydrogenase maturation nickel metallochaperone HypA n=1 Tax=Yoonia sp. R2-816 TaxID=3342638 RepID=UPI00372975CF